jgi:serine/threonine protein kinase
VKVGPSVIDTENLDVFRQERDAMLRLRGHPHVIQILDNSAQSIELNGGWHHALVLEVAPNGDMLPYVQLRPFDEVLARTYFIQLLSALRAAHSVGVYHRGIKLENLLLSSTFTLKLADFGLAHLLAASYYPSFVGTEGLVASLSPHARKISEPTIKGLCGSPGYIAPEVSKDSFYLGSGVDVWSAGCVLFAMLMGHSAFEQCDPHKRHEDPWLCFVAEEKRDLFWFGHMRFCKCEVSGFGKGITNQEAA